MIKNRYVVLSALALLSCATLLRAQGGCVDSPEAPTALLVLIGTVGVFSGSTVLRKMLHRNGKR